MRDKNVAEPQEDLGYKLENATSTHFSDFTLAFISGLASFSLCPSLSFHLSTNQHLPQLSHKAEKYYLTASKLFVRF